ncbi:hypothetical protein D0439_12775 [Lysinibacillus fusiformis]|jgi:hypothetical protein|uniref:hypothetical protein n=1 Tax=Lysinibacillus TaxID=400634 RepID=UPI0004D7F3E0|nr:MULTISPECIES: hypothetical protein [Lysinibacillus]AJK88076.1 hypothetical protein HR49_13485 [Lysinibacillus fusiformis]KGA83972.1 hypothetical protein KQ41_04030 [Lysinibacillus fusiformis]KHK49244.1 hypothetical protein PI85_20675 [Lysinibacillus sp. A1]MCE4042743.1 hypothetical protein [Lysinibacillus fusiformis]MCT6818346.1 hypothetical protein [Lysinibacillus fusiformis]
MAIAQKISNMVDQLFIFFNKAYKPKHSSNEQESYVEKYKKWDLADLSMLPEHLKITTIKQTSKREQCNAFHHN